MAKNLFYYLNGLGALPNQATFRVSLTDGYVFLDHIKLHTFKKDEVLQQYKIKAEDILAFDLVNASELKDQSVVGRGAVGAFLFGPVGALLGGMSAASKQKIKSTLVISYLSSSDGEAKTIILDAEPPSWKGNNAIFVAKTKKELAKIPKSKSVMEHLGQSINRDGSITL